MTDRWARLFPQAKRNDAAFFLDGKAYFKALSDTLQTAQKSDHFIYILGWMLDADFPLVGSDQSTTLFSLLKTASGNGVEIRILVWENLIPDYSQKCQAAFSNLNPRPHTSALADNHTFYPSAQLDFIGKKLIPAANDVLTKVSRMTRAADSLIVQLKIILGTATNPGAHHEKVVVVKNDNGLVAYCGGMDINPNRLASGASAPYPTVHDVTCRVAGPAAHEVLQRFKRRWANHPGTHGIALGGANEKPPKERPQPAPYATVVGTYNSPNGGRDRDRSGRDAYLKIIENAQSYIYIEDQYLVNLDIARALNKKIKEPNFQRLMFAIQDAEATRSDLLIPNRKRRGFLTAVTDGVNDREREKVVLAVLDRRRSAQDRYHPGMHAKTMVVDDQVAVIGSTNINQRSFTNDSETSIVVFQDGAKVEGNFARRLRSETWQEYQHSRPPASANYYESPYL